MYANAHMQVTEDQRVKLLIALIEIQQTHSFVMDMDHAMDQMTALVSRDILELTVVNWMVNGVTAVIN
jgi:hypothetical protein